VSSRKLRFRRQQWRELEELNPAERHEKARAWKNRTA
jgi:hypothetical protein